MSVMKAIDRRISVARRPDATPRVELDLSVALAAIRAAAHQVVPDIRGGTIVDVGCPALAPLLPHLPSTGTWAWVWDSPSVDRARRTTRREGMVVLDGRRLPGPVSRTRRPDLVVLGLHQVDARPSLARGAAVLIDLTDARAWRIEPSLLAPRAGVAGFHVDLARLPRDSLADCVDLLSYVLRQWRTARRGDRPLLVLRGARTVMLGRHVVVAVLRMCRAAAVPVPVMRTDVTRAVLDVAVRTVIGVLGVQVADGSPILDVDALPGSVAAPLHILGGRAAAASADHVLLRNRDRYVSARLVGGLPVQPAAELAAPGWTDIGRLPVTRRFSTVR